MDRAEEDHVNINSQLEPEEIPRWMRYMAKSSTFVNAQPHQLPETEHKDSTTTISASVDVGQRKRVKAVIKRSSNPFGPTSDHAIVIEARLRSEKRKREIDLDPVETTINMNTDAPRRKVRSRHNPSMVEAAELFSIVKLK